ncbi:MAG: hypothetical protein AAF253_04230 [Pseudomonadota bacterium]
MQPTAREAALAEIAASLNSDAPDPYEKILFGHLEESVTEPAREPAGNPVVGERRTAVPGDREAT